MLHRTTAAVIGRFQLPHLAHLRLLQAALGLADQVVIVIGSAWRSRNPKNPFVFEERRAMLLAMLTPAQRARVHVVGVRDVHDAARWVAMVRARVQAFCAPGEPVTLVGHRKDASSGYLRYFAGWAGVDAGSVPDLDSTALRALLFGSGRPLEDRLQELAPHVHGAVLQYLAGWAVQSGHFAERVDEHRANAAYQRRYPGPLYRTGDAIVEAAGHFLVIERGGALGRGTCAFPGGHQEAGESGLETALRELDEETTLGVPRERLLAALVGTRTFDAPDRSPRGRIVTTACHFRLAGFTPATLPAVHGRDDAKNQPALWLDQGGLEAVMHRFFDDHDALAEFAAGPLQPLVERQAMAAAAAHGPQSRVPTRPGEP
ncbi:adenylyltransferase/cytidyltransferase family protein [Pseudorhodoferax sp.]|uniref:adenylyltransferase/cytidyltransferase family protein n=1 Tax=Pseudorhodoferax sp. TaxID=1993553 RepID=UPI002DD68681|nr:adenylyltransferase/cytidyltransferase family protein [Pseudorhodoferax sp.]